MFVEPAPHPSRMCSCSRCIIRRSLLVIGSYFTTEENGWSCAATGPKPARAAPSSIAVKTVPVRNALRKRRMCRAYWSMAKVKLRSEFWIETTIVPGGSDLVEGPRRSPTGDAIERDLTMSFVHDQLATGGQPRVLTIVHTFSRFSPALQPRFTFRGVDVVEVVERVQARWTSGYDPPRPRHRVRIMRFGSLDLSVWCHTGSRPGKATDRAIVEVFNGRFGAEFLNAH